MIIFNDNNNIDDCNDNEIQFGLGLLLKDKSTGNHINCSFKNPFKWKFTLWL